jgi:cytochrome bd-type quinol oxidase subunit 2
MPEYRIETDSLGEVRVLADKLWGAQTQRSLEHFSIGQDLIPREMITAYAILKKAAANAHHAGKRLDEKCHQLIVQVCDEILAGQHHDILGASVWALVTGLRYGRERLTVLGSTFLLFGLLMTGAAALFPVMLFSTTDTGLRLTAADCAAPAPSLAIGVAWWIPALILAFAYLYIIQRHYSGKVNISKDNQGLY